MPNAYSQGEPRPHSLQLRVSPATIKRIDQWGRDKRMPSRSEAIRVLIDAGLDHKEAKKENDPVR